MKILYITNSPSFYRVNFFNLLGKQTDLTVLFEEEDLKNENRNKQWYGTEYKNFEAVFLNVKYIGNKKYNTGYIKYLKKAFDIIVICGYDTITKILSIRYLNKTNKKFILEIDGGFNKSGKGLKEKLKSKLIKAASYIFSSGNVVDDYLMFYGALKKNIIRYNFTSLNKNNILTKPIEKDEKIILKKKLNIKQEKIIISVGQFIYRKGFDVLLNACNTIDRNIGVYIIGDKPSEEYIQLKNKYNLSNVHFLDYMEKEMLWEYFRASDLFVLPTREDIWGLVVNEALANALPTITTDKCIAGLELIQNGLNGYIVPVNNEMDLSDKISLILNNEELRSNMAYQSLESIKNFTIENMVSNHINTFEKINKENL